MNDVFVTLLFAIYIAAKEAWTRNGDSKTKPLFLAVFANSCLVLSSVMVALMWWGVFTATWAIGLLSLYGTFVMLGELIHWDVIPPPFMAWYRWSGDKMLPANPRRGRIMKTLYHASIVAGMLFAFLTDDVKSFAADFYANVGRVDDRATADELLRQCYEQRFGGGSFFGKAHTTHVSRNYYTYTFGIVTKDRKFTVSERDGVVIKVDRRTGEAFFVDERK